MGKPRRGLSWRGLRRAFARLSIVLVVAVGVYIGLAKAGVFHSPFFVITEGDVEEARSDEPGLRVLFVGNSFTYYNDMPHMLHELAAEDSGAQPIFSVARTRGSWTFKGATDDKGLESLLEDVQWDDVVLQERSWYLSEPENWWLRETYPYAEDLQREIRAGNDQGILFETWGYRQGIDDQDSYASMQSRLDAGYEALGTRLGMNVVPVGDAWFAAHTERPGLGLWADDGRHPNRAGSYLAACVFYAEFTGRDPSESRFTAGLDPNDARFLQQMAMRVASTPS